MENIETLLAAVAQTQGFEDDEPVAPAPTEPGLKNSAFAAATRLVAGNARPSPAVETAAPAPSSALSALGPVIGDGEKRKRGRPPKSQLAAYPPPSKRKKVEDEEEDVCFICFDGGSLVLCDRKGCPKAYHPACIKRDEAFFQSKAKWNCGWHICSVCQKASYYMCYTCTYSLCKACTKNADYVCVRGNKGFCTTCIKPIMLIENKDQATDESIKVDFDDKHSWEYLFKMYWLLLKEKLSLTLSEITQAKNPSIGVATVASKPQFSNVLPTAICGEVSASCRSSEHLELNKPHVDFNLIQNDGLRTLSNGNCIEKLHNHEQENGPSCKKDTVQPNMREVTGRTCGPFIEKDLDNLGTNKPCISRNTATRESEKPAIDSTEWASKDLLEFVAHMKNGDVSPISQFDVQTLLLAYIKRNDLRDPRKKSQIICDQRLKSLFGKPRVGHIEMLKLVEFHFLLKADSRNNSFIPAGFVASMETDVEGNGNILGSSMPVNSRKRKTRKKSEDRAPQHDLNEYAAIDAHNINLIYLRRNLMENLLDDRDNINNKVIGSIVRIKLSTNDQKPEVHRLVQVVGTTVAAEPYKIGNRTADVMLEILNLDKKEIVSIDAISNQEFTEEECRRLRQSVRCGLVKHFTVGEVQKKAVALQSVKVHDWLEAEVSKLNHLRDRASEKGHKKEYPSFITICIFKHMEAFNDPSVLKKTCLHLNEQNVRIVASECVERLQLLNSPEERKLRISEIPKIHADPRMSPYYESEEDDSVRKDEYVRPSYSQFPRNRRKTKGKEDQSLETRNRVTAKAYPSRSNNVDKNTSQINIGTSPNCGRTDQATQRSGLETSTATAWEGNSPSADTIEAEKLWHYRDPNGKIQGPFSMMQLRKWSKTGLFPPDIRIWANHKQYDSLLLTDAMSGKYHAVSDLSPELSSAGSKESNPTERIGVAEVSNSTSRDIKQTEATMEVDEPGSSGRPQCLDLLKDGNSTIGDVKECCLSPPSISETRHVDPTYRCQEGDDFNRGSQTGEKNSAGITPMENEDRAGKPSEENSSSFVFESVPESVSEPPDPSKPAETIDVSDLPIPTAKTENQLSEAPATETKPPEFVSLSIPGWNGDVQLPGVNDEWCGYSPTPTRPSIEEWDPGLLSTSPSKHSEVKMEVVDSSSQPVSNKPNWLAIMNEPIEFLALGEDSVSDLLAEVDAMESQGPLPSPTAAQKFARELLEDSKDDCFSSIEAHELLEDSKDDCFSSIEEFSSVSNPRRSDVHLTTSQSSAQPPCKPTRTGTSPVDFCQRSSVNSSASSKGETNTPVHTNHDLVGTSSDPTDPAWGPLQGSTNINLVTVQGNVNLVLGGSPRGIGNLGWGTNPGWANSGPNRSPRNGSLAWDGQRKYGGERFSSPREWGYQGGELGFGRGRQPWGRQQYGGGGGGGGGYSRPVPKGQRVCKFYEGGHCKKGAYCDYLHP